MTTDEDDKLLAPEKADFDQAHGQGLSNPIKQGRRVANLRLKADLSPQVLATKAGLTLFDLVEIEAGRMTLSRSVAERLSAELGVQFVDLWVASVSQ